MNASTAVTNSASAALGAAGAGSMVIWIFQCLTAQALVVPSTEAALQMGAMAVPILHVGYRIFTGMLEKLTGIDLNDNGELGNGHKP